MQLVKVEPDTEVLKSFNDLDQYYIRLKLETPIAKLDPQVIKRACLDIITKAMMDNSPNGQSDSKILSFQSETLFNELSGKYKSLTLSELKECFRLGIRGESGPYFGMCAKTYHQFIKWWFDKPERNKAFYSYINKVNGFKIAEKPQVDESFFFKACEKAYQRYLKYGEMPEVAFCMYDWIKKMTGLKTLIKDKERVMKLAENNYQLKLKNSALKEIARGWNMVADPNSPDFNNVFANSVKEEATRLYFQELKNGGITAISAVIVKN